MDVKPVKAHPLPKYEGRDFPVWKAQVQAYLNSINKAQCLSNNKPRRIIQGTDEQKEARQAEITNFLAEDVMVKSLLLLSLDTKTARQVLACETSKEIWDRLCSTQQHKSSASKIVSQQRFFNIKLRYEESIRDYVSRAEYAFNQMVDAGAKGHNEDTLMETIIAGLPHIYTAFIRSWSLLDDLNELIGRL